MSNALGLIRTLVGLDPYRAWARLEQQSGSGVAVKHIHDAVLDETRTLSDRAADRTRRPVETLTIAGVEPGMHVLELEPGKGYYTDLFLRLIDATGSLTVQSPEPLDAFFGRQAQQRIAAAARPNATYSASPFEALAAQDGTMDRVFWIQGPHELWFVPQPGVSLGRPSKVFAEVARALKPGGRFVVIDNLAPPGSGTEICGDLHRIRPEVVASYAAEAGLELALQDERLLSNDDPLDVPTYHPGVHLRTHQFVQIFAKPSAASGSGT